MAKCPSCDARTVDGATFCSVCGARVDGEIAAGPPGTPAAEIWFKDFYRIRKKVLAIANQYWIEDAGGTRIGYSRQKILAFRESVKVFSDDKKDTELFRIQQEQVMDMWGTFAVIDSATGNCVGKLRREAISSGFYVDKYLILDAAGRQVGSVAERGGRGLIRKFVPGGSLVPEQMVVEYLGKKVAEIKQQFKVIGDIWEVDCSLFPPTFDRRTLLAIMLLMGMIERDRK